MKTSIKSQIETQCDQGLSEFEAISEFVFAHPEPGGKEEVCARYLSDRLEQNGFKVWRAYQGMPTAFRAEWGSGPVTIAFLAEYDALPGYGPGHDEWAHACGHNWISATALGSAITLSRVFSSRDIRLVVFGTPAEETLGGKCELVQNGAFDGVDFVLQAHLGGHTMVRPKTQAMDSIEFSFFGRAAHAAMSPEQGINALEAVLLLFQGINARRPYWKKSASVAGIITDGGQACNIVPDYAACRFYVRAATRQEVETLTSTLQAIGQGAQAMTGARMETRFFENSFDELRNDETLCSVVEANLRRLGIERFYEPEYPGGSSDIGNVSHVVPTMYFELETGMVPPVYAHESGFLEAVHGPLARSSLRQAVLAMTWSVADILEAGNKE